MKVNKPDPQSDLPSKPSGENSGRGGLCTIRSVEVGEETELSKGWRYEIRVFWEGGRLTEHAVELAWADHDHWSGGVCAPSRVIEAVVQVGGTSLGPDGMPEQFNASSLRSLVAGLDERVRELL